MIKLRINEKDAKQEYGASLSNGSLAALMTPPPAKERIANKSRLQHGTRIIANNDTEKVDERQITLNVHFTANSEEEFLLRYANFCKMLAGGVVNIEVELQSGRVLRYETYYQSCSQYSQFYGGIAKFALKLIEPNPNQWTRQ